ncbi:hypothetical protein C7B70_03395 [Chlorogloea sp. CCALA 695]|nr:hypothetical protein C7B70_03395 [Chlorogloea sp. CCALA 695]
MLKQIEQLSKINLKQQIQWLLRSLLVRGSPNLEAGFVLPTVAMVSLVVVLLSVALVVRAFDRSKNASNVRVNQVVLNAATPALDRAKAKLDALFRDPTLPRTTPSDIALDIAIKKSSTSDRYTFGDETRLKLVNEFNGTAGIQKQPATTLEGDETINTAWKYPIDTDNNGLFDSYTLYGIYFRSPTRDANGKFNRQRNPLEARTPPMSGGYLGSQCNNATGTTANLVGDSSWYKIGSKLTKSFYVYTATVPITNPPITNPPSYEPYKGNKGFTALEYQQDRSQIPLNNNAVLFQDDLELSPGPAFRLNGRVFTNANLLIGGHGGAIRLFQVSSKNSCYYKEENAKINVGGNVGTGNINDTTNQTSVNVDLYNGSGNDPITGKVIDGSNKSTTSTGGAAVGYNDTAYNNRIALMKRTALSYSTTNPPTIASVNAVTRYPDKEVKSSFSAKVTANPSLDTLQVLEDVIEVYLKDRTRRVPYAEVATPDTNAIGTFTTTNVFATGTIEPPTAWREPTDANTGLTLSATQLEQTDPDKQKELGKEVLLGDRINVGNNLPAYWKNTLGKFVTGPFERQFLGSTIFWNNPADKPRFRTTQVIALPDLGISDRTGFWEDTAAQTPATTTSNVGGLRVVTGAGIYVDDDGSTTVGTPNYSRATYSFLRRPQLDPGVGVTNPISKFITASITTGNDNIVTWTDMMPMTGGAGETRKGDLQMRATAIYHYKDTSYTDTNYINRTPTACISSYYDPTNSVTSRNTVGLPDLAALPAVTTALNAGRSNNGIVYPAPYATDATRVTAVGTYRSQLNRQARLVFPNGRIVNDPLRKALIKIDASGTRSLADNSAIDTAICGIRILTDTGFLPSATPPIAHGAIKESSFLDARQAKALDRKPGLDSSGNLFIEPVSPTELDATGADGNYNLQLEQRQPLEIRVTDIDMNLLRTKTIGGTPNQEYMLPNSGIIYATREDALLDLSNTTSQKELLSPTDFKLDPTRRPNGIRLINGSNLARDNNFRAEEKGLILVTNLPVYIKGNFNLHQKPGGGALREEFTATLDDTWSNFYSRTAATLNTNFACRINQPGCGTEGDQWRPATIISDATSLMSTGFLDGFRDLGDYDLNNNAGFSTIANRLKNGFFENSFAISALWWNTANTANNPFPSGKTTNSYVSSYLTNGVTPVQRRTDFPEYVMEICRKIPVSECQPGDWVVGYDADNNGVILTTEQDIKARNLPASAVASQLVAGTTAKPALQATDRRYARRVAFKRKNDSNMLELTDWTAPNAGQITPIPIGINSSGQVADFAYNSGTNVPRVADNGLWFRTTNNTNGRPFCRSNNIPAGLGCTADDRVYADNKPLYYDDATTKLILPETPDIPGIPPSNSLNLPAGNQGGSDYTVCIGNGNQPGSQQYEPATPFAGTNCPSTTADAINDFLGVGGAVGLLDLTPTTSLPSTSGTVNATGNLNVISLPNSLNNGTTITLNSTDQNAIFVLQASSNLSFGSNCNNDNGSGCGAGVTLVLNGVNPNNIFWAINGSLDFNNVSAPGHQLLGNFVGKGAGKIGANTNIQGRILGVSNIPTSQYGTTGINITAITTTDQPALTPVLQVHSPGGTPATNLNTTTGSIQADWIQAPSGETTFNAALVTGNSPSRPAEESAGLHNFVRFMERWSNTTVNIKGSFIQLKKSAYATGSFSPIRSTGAAPIVGSNNGSLSIFNYSQTLYPQAGGGSTLTFYTAPTRQWGFDVALLTQPPDLFAQRFTQQSNIAPDEFFRQVGQGDPWVQNLLCAAQGSASNYTAAIGDQRPANCPALNAYND